MKLIDMAILDNNMKRKEIISGLCPFNCGLGLGYDPMSITKKGNGLTNGCRGITCKECWNQEYKEVNK